MPSRLVIPIAFLCSAVLPHLVYAADLQGTITWNSGDWVRGELLGGHAGAIEFLSPLFQEPLAIDCRYVDSIEIDTDVPPKQAEGSFRVASVLGDVLFGDLLELDDQHLRLRSSRFGDITLNRNVVMDLRQLRHARVLFDGPRWLDGWRVLKAGRRLDEWTAEKHGDLSTNKYGGEIYRDLPAFEIAEVELVIHWQGQPGFQVDFSPAATLIAAQPKPHLSIKSWGNDVVAQTSLSGSNFQPLLEIPAQQRELRFRLQWDNRRGEVAVYQLSGKLLARLPIEKSTAEASFGILVKNRSDHLTLERIKLTEWSGLSADREVLHTSFVQRDDGTTVGGTEIVYEPDSKSFRIGADGGDELVPLDQFATAVFRGQASPANPIAHARFHDGTELFGDIVQLDASTISLRTPLSDVPISGSLDQIDAFRFFENRVAEHHFQLELAGDHQLRGNLGSHPDSHAPAWLVDGGSQAVRIAMAKSATIERLPGSSQSDVEAYVPSEMVFLRDGTTITGEVTAIDEDWLHVTTLYSQTEVIPVAEVKAVEIFSGSGRISFASPSWEYLRDTQPLQRSHEQLEVAQSVSFRDLAMQHDGRLTLSCAWDEDFVGLLTVHLGTSTQQPRTSIARFTFSRDRVSARCLQQPISYRELPKFAERRATIAMQGNGKRLDVWVNGILAFECELTSEIAQKGLWIQCGSAKGPLNRSRDGQEKLARLVLDGLRVGEGAGRLSVGLADADQKSILLQLPRHRSPDTLTHVLCAKNGDLLRGQLLGMNDKTVTFRSLYEDFPMARSEIAALIWLNSPTPATSVAANASTPLGSAMVGERAGDDPLANGAPEAHDGAHTGATNGANDDTTCIALRDGSVFFLRGVQFDGQMLSGLHPSLHRCQIMIDRVLKIQHGNTGAWLSAATFGGWTPFRAPEPDFSELGDGAVEQGFQSPLLGASVEDVVVPRLTGIPTKLADHRDKVLVLNFWASWSAPCARSVPKLVALVREFPEQSVELLAINQAERAEEIELFMMQRFWDFPVYVDSDSSLARKFMVETLPQTVIVAPGGKIARVFVGTPTGLEEGIRQAIREVMPPSD